MSTLPGCDEAESVIQLTRTEFNEVIYLVYVGVDIVQLTRKLFAKAMVPVEAALNAAKLRKGDLHAVFLAGGSSRIPGMKELLKNFFQDIVGFDRYL